MILLKDRFEIGVSLIEDLKEKKDTTKITFRTRYDYYEFLVMSFGLTNTPVDLWI